MERKEGKKERSNDFFFFRLFFLLLSKNRTIDVIYINVGIINVGGEERKKEIVI